MLVGWADQKDLEKGRKIRVDATGVESNIHYPTDSQLLVDAIRVLTRLLKRLRKRRSVTFVDHCRRAKRRCLNILNSRGPQRKKHYQDLLKVARNNHRYHQRALEQAEDGHDPISQALAQTLNHYQNLLEQVVQQTERRVLHGEKVPAARGWSPSLKSTRTFLKKGPGRASLVISCF